MPLTKVGLNLTRIQNISTPSFDIKNTSTDLINDIPTKANEITGGYFGIVSLSILWAFLMWKLNQNMGGGGDYGYNSARSIGIASAICSIIGLYAINIGYFANFYHVVIFIVGTFISVGVVWKSQR